MCECDNCKVLITGAKGQLGLELQATAPAGLEVVALDRRHLDLTDPVAIQKIVGSIKPDVIINAAAYTAVDQAERENRQAFAVNRDGPLYLARMAADMGITLVHVSTDFVFDGFKSTPYGPDDAAKPLGVYGKSKLAGEEAMQRVLHDQGLIVRTSWLYSVYRKNFVMTMLGLLQEKNEVTVVADQVGTPTWAKGLARALWDMVLKDLRGVYHWSDAGVASWFDFAVGIQKEALALGLLAQKKVITPVDTFAFQTPARRPAYSVLDKTKTRQDLGYYGPHWLENLQTMLIDLREVSPAFHSI